MTSMAKAAVQEKTIEVVGADGCVTTLIQRPDGAVEIYTNAMAGSGHAVHVTSPVSGSGGRAQVRPVRICH